MTSTPLPLHWAGEHVWLCPERALWWPAAQTLFVADVHLGKAAAYRVQGQPVPAGTTDENLDRLQMLLAAYPARRLVFLGDLMHAPQGMTPSLLERVASWRNRHAGMEMVLVRGNHDLRAGDPPPELGVNVVDEPWSLGPFTACHHPRRLPGRFVLAGHLHPSVTLSGPARDRVRLPCFCVEQPELPDQAGPEGLAILPAFGAFTGTWGVQAAPGRQVYAVGGGAVWPVPLSAAAAGG
jgi:DNA ligase-associated metallophosphoesterase